MGRDVVVTSKREGPPPGSPRMLTSAEGTPLALCLFGLADLPRATPVRLTYVTGAVAVTPVVLGWLVWPDWLAGRAVLALVVSAGLWQTSSPWPLRRPGGGPPTR